MPSLSPLSGMWEEQSMYIGEAGFGLYGLYTTLLFFVESSVAPLKGEQGSCVGMFKPLIKEALSADEVDVYDHGTGIKVIAPFAQSEDGQTTVSIECRADVDEHEDRKFYNFSFLITVTPSPDNALEVLELWAPGTASQYIPSEVRPILLRTVAECYKAMVRKIDKDPIYRVSYGSGAVPARNEMLTTTLENEGYEVEETGTDEFGRTFWLMVPKSDSGTGAA